MRKIIVFGDSTTSQYSEEYYPQQGWAYYLPKHVDARMEIKNFAQCGASLKRFLYSADYIDGKTKQNDSDKSSWNRLILPQVTQGDIFIFYWAGINDMLQSGRDGYREADGGAYVRDWQNLSKESYIWIGEGLGTHEFFTLRSELDEMAKLFRTMIQQVQEKGGIPVVVKGTGKYYKIHDDDKNVISVNRKYADMVIDVAKVCGVAHYDIGSWMDEQFSENGYEKTMNTYFLPIGLVKRLREQKGVSKPLPYVDDNVHYNCDGAKMICAQVVDQIKSVLEF